MSKWRLEKLPRNKPFYQWLSANTTFEKNNALAVWKKINCAVEGLLPSQCIWIYETRTRSESCAWYFLNKAFGSDDFLRIYNTQVGVSPLVLSTETDITSTYCFKHKGCVKGTKSLCRLANSSCSVGWTVAARTTWLELRAHYTSGFLHLMLTDRLPVLS